MSDVDVAPGQLAKTQRGTPPPTPRRAKFSPTSVTFMPPAAATCSSTSSLGDAAHTGLAQAWGHEPPGTGHGAAGDSLAQLVKDALCLTITASARGGS